MDRAEGLDRSAVPGEPEQRANRVELVFARDPSGRTYLRRQFAAYPYHICRPLIFGGDPPGMVTLYLQSCSGGIFRHDRLRETIVGEPGAQALVTTQAATIVHSMEAGEARQSIAIDAEEGSLLEVLPDPLILFPRSRLRTHLAMRAHPDATVIAAESFILHDPAGGGATFDWLHATSEIFDGAGAVLARDRFRLTGEVLKEALPGLNGPYSAQGTLFVLHRQRPVAEILTALRAAVEPVSGAYAGASELPRGCGAWMRVLAHDSAALRASLTAAWGNVRECLTGLRPAPRRK
jgi:urease accessory protein